MKSVDRWLLLPGLAWGLSLAAVAMGTQGGVDRAGLALSFAGALLIWVLAVAVRLRHPTRPLWRLLVALAAVYASQPLVTSSSPLLYTFGRAARPGVELLLIWVMLAFPTGRLAGLRERVMLGGIGLSVLLLWLPGMMLSPHVPFAGPFASCQASCPRNMLVVADRPELAAGFFEAFRWTTVAALFAVTGVVLLKLRDATALMRRTLAPVAFASLLRLVVLVAFLAQGTQIFSWSFLAVPAAMAWGLVRGRLFAARALQQLVSGLVRRPAPAELQQLMAQALGDATLRLGFRDGRDEQWRDAQGQPLALPDADDARRTARLLDDEQGRPVAALIHDRMLLEEPLLLDALSASMRSALVAHQAELALAAGARERSSAVESERRRIERDLHDGAQQRLLALRMKLAVARRLAVQDGARAASLLAEADTDIQASLDEVRRLARGFAPPELVERGLAAALEALARRAPLRVHQDLAPVGRLDPACESALFFCCAEALQNAGKHTGPGAQAWLTLTEAAGGITLSIEDDGPGLSAQGGGAGSGLTNMRERMASVGGRLTLGASARGGLRVALSLPAASLAR